MINVIVVGQMTFVKSILKSKRPSKIVEETPIYVMRYDASYSLEHPEVAAAAHMVLLVCIVFFLFLNLYLLLGWFE